MVRGPRRCFLSTPTTRQSECDAQKLRYACARSWSPCASSTRSTDPRRSTRHRSAPYPPASPPSSTLPRSTISRASQRPSRSLSDPSSLRLRRGSTRESRRPTTPGAKERIQNARSLDRLAQEEEGGDLARRLSDAIFHSQIRAARRSANFPGSGGHEHHLMSVETLASPHAAVNPSPRGVRHLADNPEGSR